MSDALGVGVVGYGYWGPNLARNFAEVPDVRVAAVSDVREERLAEARRRVPGAALTRSARELIADPAVDAVAISTPVSTHFELALDALRAGKHVLLTKPMTASADDAARLIDAAAQRGLVLMIDHTYVFTGAVRRIREIVRDDGFGPVYYYDSVRVNLGLFQHDVNVIWDLAVHDLAIMDHVLGTRPAAVSATGMAHVPGGVENIAYLTAFFDTDTIAHIGVNWLAPVKVRQTLIAGPQRMIVYDDLEPSEKVKVYDKGITVGVDESPERLYRLAVGYRTGDMWAPRLATTEALRVEAEHFADCIRGGTTPITDGEAGLRVVEVLEAASRSLRERGRPVRIGQPVRAR
ncbi:MAG TPA: Gfo/Idh/MocA family oxidoreductase [Gemmatimonadota bacterium]